MNEVIIRNVNDQRTKILNIVQEELAELIQAISKYRRSLEGDFDKDKAIEMVIEEMADVMICLQELELLIDGKERINIMDSINAMIKVKELRMKERLDKKFAENEVCCEVPKDSISKNIEHHNRIEEILEGEY